VPPDLSEFDDLLDEDPLAAEPFESVEDDEFCALINNQTVNYFYLTEMKLIEVNTNRE
jgi:hypothetical protein